MTHDLLAAEAPTKLAKDYIRDRLHDFVGKVVTQRAEGLPIVDLLTGRLGRFLAWPRVVAAMKEDIVHELSS
jgi:hypothetical protein